MPLSILFDEKEIKINVDLILKINSNFPSYILRPLFLFRNVKYLNNLTKIFIGKSFDLNINPIRENHVLNMQKKKTSTKVQKLNELAQVKELAGKNQI